MDAVLIVDDDIKLGNMLRQYLQQHNIELEVFGNGETGLRAASSGRYDLLLLDVALPDADGFEVLQRLRKTSDLSVMLLTARGEASDRIRGLQLGADDYLPKPFDPEELVARIKAILRRRPGTHPGASSLSERRRLSLGGLVVDQGSRSAKYRDHLLALTDIELSLLESFMQSPDVVLSREDLVSRVFDRPFDPLNRTLDVHVSRLRRKLIDASMAGNPIKTIRSTGYLFSVAVL